MGDDDTTPRQLRLPRSLLAAYQRWTEELNARRRRGRPLSRNDVFRMGLAFLLEQKPDIEAPPGAAAALGVDWDKVPLPRPWRPGDPEPPNPLPPLAHIHSAASADPWSTLCGQRAPLSSFSPGPPDCPGCVSKFYSDEDPPTAPQTRQEGPRGGQRAAPDPDVAQEISKAEVERLAAEAGTVAPHQVQKPPSEPPPSSEPRWIPRKFVKKKGYDSGRCSVCKVFEHAEGAYRSCIPQAEAPAGTRIVELDERRAG